MFLSQAERVKTEFLSLSQNKLAKFFFYLLILFLPTQFGKHFWPDSSFVYGLRLDYLSPTIYLTDIFIFLIFVFSIKAQLRILRRIKKLELGVFSIFILSLIIGISLAKNPAAGVYGLIKFFEFSYLAFYIYQNIKSFNKKILFYSFLIGLIFESSLSFLQYINQGSIGGIFYFFGERQYSFQTPGIAKALINGQLILRPYATFSHTNVFAGYLIVNSFFLFLFIPKGKIAKSLLTIAFIFTTLSLTLSLSRVSILDWIVCLLFLFGILIYKKYKKGKSNVKISFIAIAGLLVLFSAFLFQKSIIIQRFLSTSLLDESIKQREDLIHQAISMFSINPVFGVGLNNFFNNLSPFSEKILLIQPVHNIFILMLSETGVIGFLFLLFILVLGIARILSLKGDKRNYLICIFFSFCFLGSFDHYFFTLQQGQLLFTIFLSLTLSAKSLN